MKIRRALALAALLAAVILPAAAIPTKALSYWGVCNFDINNYRSYLYHARLNSETVDTMYGEILYMRNTHTCTIYDEGASFVLPVNIQGYAYIQFGYGRLQGSDTDQWLYTKDPGVVTQNVLVAAPASVPNPVVGHEYRLLAQFYGPTSRFRYTVWDLTTGSSWFWDGNSGGHHYGYDSWAGFEVYNTYDQFGGAGIYTTIREIRYQRVGETTNRYYTLSNTSLDWCCANQGDFKRADWETVEGAYADGHAYVRARSNGF